MTSESSSLFSCSARRHGPCTATENTAVICLYQLQDFCSMVIINQGWLNPLKVVKAQLTNKTHLYCEKLYSYTHRSYEHLLILWGQVPPVPPGSAAYDLMVLIALQSQNSVSKLSTYIGGILVLKTFP